MRLPKLAPVALTALCAAMIGCGKSGDGASRPAAPSAEAATSVPVVAEAVLKQILADARGQVVVLNFWATWCAPCVEEMPHFKRLMDEYGDRGVRVIAVSFDEVETIPTHVVPFIEKNGYPFEFAVKATTDGPQYESFVNAVDPEWMGNVPATFIYDREGVRRSETHEALNYEWLEKQVQPLVGS